MFSIDLKQIVDEEKIKFLNKGYSLSEMEINVLAYGIKIGIMKTALFLADVKFENDILSESEE